MVLSRVLRCCTLLALLWLSGCSLAPAERFDREAQRLGFTKQLQTGDGFEHALYSSESAGAGALLHVYLGGDGSPWLAGRWVAADPTPTDPLMLRLMALDPAPSLYLGRPCYHGLADQPRCVPTLWTDDRYSQRVVNSMAAALIHWQEEHPYPGTLLFGYSGGGTLAMLLAQRLPTTRAVITLGANLDTDRWTAYHGYRPLANSLNPVLQPPLPDHIYQLHLTGGRDRTVPADNIGPLLARHPHAEHQHFVDFDHRCCWERIWPDLLEQTVRETMVRLRQESRE